MPEEENGEAPTARPSTPGNAPDAHLSGKSIVGFLTSREPGAPGAYWVLRPGESRVGRSEAALNLHVPIDNPTVSSNHAIITVDLEKHIAQIEDCQSANGTLLNDNAIAGHGKREIRDGDRVRFGAFNAIIKLIEPI